MTFDTLRFEIDDGVGRITLRRPDNANAMNPTLAHELLEAAIACDVDPAVRLESQMELESAAITEAAIGADGQEGIAAFLEKRKPMFQGR